MAAGAAVSNFFIPSVATDISLNLNDGDVSQYPRAYVYDGGSLSATIDLSHDALGRYRGSWVPAAAVDYDVVFVVFSDAGRTIESPTYTREQERWQPSPTVSAAGAVWGANLASYVGPGTAAESLSRLTAARAAIIDVMGPNTDLTLKILRNRLELADGATGNWVLFDDDSVTPLLTFSVSDKDGNPILQPVSAPSRRTRGI